MSRKQAADAGNRGPLSLDLRQILDTIFPFWEIASLLTPQAGRHPLLLPVFDPRALSSQRKGTPMLEPVDHLSWDINGHIATLTIAWPEKRNAMTDAMYRGMRRWLFTLDEAPEVRRRPPPWAL